MSDQQWYAVLAAMTIAFGFGWWIGFASANYESNELRRILLAFERALSARSVSHAKEMRAMRMRVEVAELKAKEAEAWVQTLGASLYDPSDD
jgi:truncated hemoglobin YjbI